MFFFFNDTATTEIYTLSLHDALPISIENYAKKLLGKSTRDILPEDYKNYKGKGGVGQLLEKYYFMYEPNRDRKSTRLNSNHANISYAVFCLKKKKNHRTSTNFKTTTQ